MNLLLNRNEKFSQLAILLALSATLAGLGLMAYLGFYNRYWAEDWCYNTDFRHLGVLNTVGTYFLSGPAALRGYSTNRYSLTLLAGILYLAGIVGAKLTATLAIVLWLAALHFLFSNLSKILGLTFGTSWILGATTILYYTLFLSPQRFQTLYWIAGVHYSFTMIGGVLLLGLIASQIVLAQRSKLTDFFIALVAFVAGGFSEGGCVFLLSFITLLWIASAYWKRRGAAWAAKSFASTTIAFLFLVLSVGVLALSPSNAARVDFIAADQVPLARTILLSLRFSIDFIVSSLRSLRIPHLVFILLLLSISVLSGPTPSDSKRNPIWKIAIPILATIVSVWLVIAAVQTPSVHFYGTPPDPRGKTLARFALLVGIAVCGWIAGQAIRLRWQSNLLNLAAALMIVFCGLYTARTIALIYAELPGFVYRAQVWDARDESIRKSLAQGIDRVEVTVIDMSGTGVRDIMRSKSIDRGWVMSCGTAYYGLAAIKAAQP